MKGTGRRKNRQPTLQPDDCASTTSNNNNNGKTTPAPSSAEPPEEWRLEAAIVSLLTLTDGDNRLICPPFRVLPSPAEFPLYYEHIKNPIDLKCIAERVRSNKYADWAALEADIKLLRQNTKDFSESGPMLCKDADLLFDQFRSRANELSGARRFSARVLARNKEYIDELLRSTASEVDEYSEDSEEDEDSERSDAPAWRLYWTIRNFDVVNGVPLCENFMELPSKRSYPDYYEETERPMSLYMINKKLKRGQYGVGAQQQLHSLVQDLLLMFDNACAYNIEESDIYEAAQRLRKLTLQTSKKLGNTASKTNNIAQKVKQEMEDHVDDKGEKQKHQQQQPSPSAAAVDGLPKMNGTAGCAVPPAPPAAKRRKMVPKGDDAVIIDVVSATTNATTNNSTNNDAAAAPLRRPVKREAYAKGEQAIKRMVDSDLEDDAMLMVEQQRPNAAAAVHHNHQNNILNNNDLKNAGDISAAVPSSSSAKTMPNGEVGAVQSSTAAPHKKSHHRAPRRLNADGTPAERLKPGRKSVDELREKFAQKLTAIWQDVQSLKLGNRSLAEPFLCLPCEKTFPDYYRAVTKPISLACIQQKIKEQQYADSDKLLADLRLMFANARVYNKPDAQICADATILESVAVGSMRTHTEGVTLFYPYRRTDKGWSEKASIERSPLKMKRKGVFVVTVPSTASSSTAAGASLSTATARQPPHPPASTVVVHVHRQQHQQSMPSAKQQQQHQYFPSSSSSSVATSALMNGMPPTAAVQQASSSVPASSVGTTVVSHLHYLQQHIQTVQQQLYAQQQQTHGSTASSDAGQSPLFSPSSVGSCATVAPSSSQSARAIATGSAPIAAPSMGPMVQQPQQVIIDSGRTVVNATPKSIEPVFVEPSTSVKVQRVLHSEAYVRYIESMYGNKVQRTVSKWDKNLQATQRNTKAPTPSSAGTSSSSVFFDAICNGNNNNNNRRQLAQQWIRLASNGSKHREEQLVHALWTLRDQLIEGNLGIARHAELPAGEPPPPPQPSTMAFTATPASLPSSSGNKNDRNNNRNGTAAMEKRLG